MSIDLFDLMLEVKEEWGAEVWGARFYLKPLALSSPLLTYRPHTGILFLKLLGHFSNPGSRKGEVSNGAW